MKLDHKENKVDVDAIHKSIVKRRIFDFKEMINNTTIGGVTIPSISHRMSKGQSPISESILYPKLVACVPIPLIDKHILLGNQHEAQS